MQVPRWLYVVNLQLAAHWGCFQQYPCEGNVGRGKNNLERPLDARFLPFGEITAPSVMYHFHEYE